MLRPPSARCAEPETARTPFSPHQRKLAAHRLQQPEAGAAPGETVASAAAGGGARRRLWWRVAGFALLIATSVLVLLFLGLHVRVGACQKRSSASRVVGVPDHIHKHSNPHARLPVPWAGARGVLGAHPAARHCLPPSGAAPGGGVLGVLPHPEAPKAPAPRRGGGGCGGNHLVDGSDPVCVTNYESTPLCAITSPTFSVQYLQPRELPLVCRPRRTCLPLSWHPEPLQAYMPPSTPASFGLNFPFSWQGPRPFCGGRR